VKPVALEFSADLFRGNFREKDLESISLDVIDEAHAISKPHFRGFAFWVFWIAAKRFSSRRMLAELFARV
jgi:hypothetical protein